jgi:hypothetical protein
LGFLFGAKMVFDPVTKTCFSCWGSPVLDVTECPTCHGAARIPFLEEEIIYLDNQLYELEQSIRRFTRKIDTGPKSVS